MANLNEFTCIVDSIQEINGTEFYIIHNILNKEIYKIPVHKLINENIKVGFQYSFIINKDVTRNKYYLQYSGKNKVKKDDKSIFKYEIGRKYYFKIITINEIVNKKGNQRNQIVVQDLNLKTINVLGLKWQNNLIWKYKDLYCEVESFDNNGAPSLINRDFRHPIFKIGVDYIFTVIDSKIKTTINGDFNVYVLKGIDNCLHEVNMLPGQKLLKEKPEQITCRVVNITTTIRLHQTNIKDPFYVEYNEIINNKIYYNKYFKHIIDDNDNNDKYIIQLKEQYDSKEAFWVFTYTNKILPYLFKNCIERYDYTHACEINQIIIFFEKWIITKGIITSFPSDIMRTSTKHRAQNALTSAIIKNEILNLLLKNNFNILNNDEYFKENNKIERLYFVLSFSKFEILNTNDFYKRLMSLFSDKNEFANNKKAEWIKIINLINLRKKIFLSEQEKEVFNLTTSNYRLNKLNEYEQKYLDWCYFETIISVKIKLSEHANLTIAQMLTINTKSVDDIYKKENLLFNAYQFLNEFQYEKYDIPFNWNNKVVIYIDKLNNTSFDRSNSWEEIEYYFNEKKTFKVQLKNISKTGYEVIYKDINGFLPIHHITNGLLRAHQFSDSSFYINVRCLSISTAFQFFIIEQTSDSMITNLNGEIIKPIINNVYNGIIKKVYDYGIFITTDVGEGLLYKSEVFDFPWQYDKFSNNFKTGQKIKVEIISVDPENKIQFSFRSIKNKDIIYYNNYIENIQALQSNDLFDTEIIQESNSYLDKVLIEKAYCIEQYAVLQFDITLKLYNFKIAKQFYSNANNYRSYLINIYIAYFDILLNIKNTLLNNSLDEITVIQKDALEIKEKINEKTIQTFPDSEKLIFFLDIFSHFNKKDEFSFNLLFTYITKYNNSNENRDLRTIAKITLANNLLISETSEDKDFVLKNLRLIYDYISKGILTLEETIEDKTARELKELQVYWESKINEDESENLEFKSSLFTPILDEKAKNKLEILNSSLVKNENIERQISKLNGVLASKLLIHSCLKTLAAFANSSGGTLLIGVDNQKNIIGINNEYQSNKQKLLYPNRDGYGLFFDDLIKNYFGDSFSSLINRRFLKFKNGDILIIEVKKSSNEVFLLKDDEGKEREQLYIRNLSSSKELIGSELAKFIKNKHMETILKSNNN